MIRSALATLTLVIGLSPVVVLPAAAGAPDLGLQPQMDEVQQRRFCRPGERPTSPRQCVVRGRQTPIR